MDEIEQLIGFGEFALALAGFAAIALVLGRGEGILSSGSAYVVQFMVVNALGPALLVLLAVVLLQLDLSEEVVLRTCSGIYLVVAAFSAASSALRERRLGQAGELVLPTTLSRSFWVGSMLAHLIQLSNLTGVPAGPSLGLFLLGLWILLCIAAAQFVALLFLAFR